MYYTLFLLQLEPGTAGDGFGEVLATRHDLDGDGIDDLVVGAPGDDSTGTDAGAVYVYSGVTDGYLDTAAPTMLFGEVAGDRFGGGLAVGDVNGDGALELGVYGSGCACVTVLTAADGFASRTVLTGTTGTQFGSSFDFGDLNGDGRSDLLVGAWDDATAGEEAGAVHVYYGADEGLPASPDLTVYGSVVGGRAGYAVRSAGDVDGDGDDELLVGSPYGGTWEEGELEVWYGGPSGLAATYDWATSGVRYTLGTILSRGDFNGDGYSDVAGGVRADEPNAPVLWAPGGPSGLGPTTEEYLYVMGYTSHHPMGLGADGDGDGVDELPYCGVFWGDWSLPDPDRWYACDYGEATLPFPDSLEAAGPIVSGARDEVWFGESETVALAATFPDADGDGFLRGLGEPLEDCDDGDAAVHPFAVERAGDGLDTDCDGGDAPALSTAPVTCRSVASYAEARALLDADERVATPVPGWVAEGQDPLIASPQWWSVSASDGEHDWSRGWLGGGSAPEGTAYELRDGSADYTDAWEDIWCDSERPPQDITVFDVAWPEGTSTGLVHMAAHRHATDWVDEYAGVGEWADGTVRAFNTVVRSCTGGGTEASPSYAVEGLRDRSDGCTFDYLYVSGRAYFSGWRFSGTQWSFEDGAHSFEVSTGETELCADSRGLTVGRQDGGGFRPIDPSTWAPLDAGPDDGDGDGWTEAMGDCDDADPTAFPCAVETPGCVDQDCDGATEDSDGDLASDCADCAPENPDYQAVVEWFGGDADGDGYGATSLGFACEPPETAVSSQHDCDDANRQVSPDGMELCDGVDNDCDEAVDESTRHVVHPDADGDGYGDPDVTATGQGACPGVVDSSDCDDADPTRHPGATEVLADGIDQDCDGRDQGGRVSATAPATAPDHEAPGCFGDAAWLFGAFGLAGQLRRRRRAGKP